MGGSLCRASMQVRDRELCSSRHFRGAAVLGSLGLQIAQTRLWLYTVGPKVGVGPKDLVSEACKHPVAAHCHALPDLFLQSLRYTRIRLRVVCDAQPGCGNPQMIRVMVTAPSLYITDFTRILFDP